MSTEIIGPIENALKKHPLKLDKNLSTISSEHDITGTEALEKNKCPAINCSKLMKEKPSRRVISSLADAIMH